MKKEKAQVFLLEMEELCKKHGVVLDVDLQYGERIYVKVKNYVYDERLDVESWRDYGREKGKE